MRRAIPSWPIRTGISGSLRSAIRSRCRSSSIFKRKKERAVMASSFWLKLQRRSHFGRFRISLLLEVLYGFLISQKLAWMTGPKGLCGDSGSNEPPRREIDRSENPKSISHSANLHYEVCPSSYVVCGRDESQCAKCRTGAATDY